MYFLEHKQQQNQFKSQINVWVTLFSAADWNNNTTSLSPPVSW